MSVDDIVEDIASGVISDGSADFIQLTEQLGIVQKISELVLGLLVTIIIIGIPIVVSIELMYINFPVIQQKYEHLVIQSSGKLNSVLGLTVRDARLALMKANTLETGKSVNWIYLRLKVAGIFIAILCVGIVVGAGPSIINFIMQVAKSILDGFMLAS